MILLWYPSQTQSHKLEKQWTHIKRMLETKWPQRERNHGNCSHFV